MHGVPYVSESIGLDHETVAQSALETTKQTHQPVVCNCNALLIGNLALPDKPKAGIQG
jgi:hypothetical protein